MQTVLGPLTGDPKTTALPVTKRGVKSADESYSILLCCQADLKQEAQLLLGDRATRKHAKDS